MLTWPPLVPAQRVLERYWQIVDALHAGAITRTLAALERTLVLVAAIRRQGAREITEQREDELSCTSVLFTA